jgi:hypothetical protein
MIIVDTIFTKSENCMGKTIVCQIFFGLDYCNYQTLLAVSVIKIVTGSVEEMGS